MRMKTQLFFGALAYSLSLLSTEVQAGTPACTSLKERSAERHEIVVFSEDFDQKSRIPDSEYWSFIPAGAPVWQKHMSGSVREASVKKGKLILRARKKDGIYRCGGIWSLGKIAFGPGHRIEVGARFGRLAPGAWPAIWLMPEKPIYPGWPACGEIDIMEHLNCDDFVYQTVHSHFIHHHTAAGPSGDQQTPKIDIKAFHRYAVEISDDALVFYIDDIETFRHMNLHLPDERQRMQWPFKTRYYLILNLALGGWAGEIEDAELPVEMEVDYVRVTKLSEE